MTNFSDEEIIEMAQQAGFGDMEGHDELRDYLITFARLIAARQREIDAGIADEYWSDTFGNACAKYVIGG